MGLLRSVSCGFLALFIIGPMFEAGAAMHRDDPEHFTSGPVRRAGKTGIREVVPAHARQKYQNWKDELLSTEYGRAQWNAYAGRKDFLLTIVVSNERKYGAGTGDFEWDDDGNLIGARITLGKSLDKGYPDPVYYPIMNSLAVHNSVYEIDGDILASAKIIHEIEHVNSTAGVNAGLFQRQNKLMASYNNIFLSNGYNTKDPRLVALATELGANPVEIWENREYESEAAAMRFLIERINREWFYCAVLGRMKRNITDHARGYQDKFDAVAAAVASTCPD